MQWEMCIRKIYQGWYCQEWLTHSPQVFGILCYSPYRSVVLLTFHHWRYSSDGCAYPSVIPVAHVVSPHQSLDLMYGHLLGVMAAIEEFLLHPGPHALASGVVMAPSPGGVHTLLDTVLLNSFSVFITGVLWSPVYGENAWIQQDFWSKFCLFKKEDNGLWGKEKIHAYSLIFLEK